MKLGLLVPSWSSWLLPGLPLGSRVRCRSCAMPSFDQWQRCTRGSIRTRRVRIIDIGRQSLRRWAMAMASKTGLPELVASLQALMRRCAFDVLFAETRPDVSQGHARPLAGVAAATSGAGSSAGSRCRAQRGDSSRSRGTWFCHRAGRADSPWCRTSRPATWWQARRRSPMCTSSPAPLARCRC